MNYSHFNQKDDPADSLINDAYRAVHFLHRHLVNVPGQKLLHHHLAILTMLEQNGPLPTTEIARRLSLTKPQMTQFIDTLVCQKAVVREDDLTDRRRVLINLTDTGKSMLSDYRNLVRENIQQKFKNLTPSEIDALAQALKQIAQLAQKLS